MLGHILWTAINAVMPIILLIGVGYALKRMGLMNENFIKIGQSLVFKLFLPAMLFVNVYEVSGIGAIQWDVVIYCLVIIFAMFGVGYVAANATSRDLRRKGVIWQCAFRSNFAIIGLPLANSLGGSAGAAIAAVLSAFTVPLFNVLSVVALSTYVNQSKGKRSFGKFLLDIVKNPLIVGVAAGLLALMIRGAQEAIFGEVVFSLKRDLEFVYDALDSLKAMASPLALVVLGGQCEFSAVKGLKKEILVSTLCRIVIAPLIGITGAVLLCQNTQLLHCGNAEYAALIAQFGSPVAVSSAVMAAEMDNDEQLAAQLVVWTSVGSMVTIFLTVCVLMGMGYLAL